MLSYFDAFYNQKDVHVFLFFYLQSPRGPLDLQL